MGNNRALMDKLASRLLEKETITGEEFLQIIRQYDGETLAKT